MNRKTLIAMAIAATFSAGLITTVAQPAFAATASSTDKSSTKSSVNKLAEKDLGKISNDAALAMRNIHDARIAIFDGEPEAAQTYIDAAITRIDSTDKDAKKFAVDTKQKAKPDDTYVAYDETLLVTDKYVPTEKKARHIAKANKHLNHGDKKAAIEELKLANIDVALGMHLVPVKFAEQEIRDASKLVDHGKYYEANLALKSVQDAVVMETVATDGKPKAKSHS